MLASTCQNFHTLLVEMEIGATFLKGSLLISISWHFIFNPLFPLLQIYPEGRIHKRMFVVALPVINKKLLTTSISINRRRVALIMGILYNGILVHNEKRMRRTVSISIKKNLSFFCDLSHKRRAL